MFSRFPWCFESRTFGRLHCHGWDKSIPQIALCCLMPRLTDPCLRWRTTTPPALLEPVTEENRGYEKHHAARSCCADDDFYTIARSRTRLVRDMFLQVVWMLPMSHLKSRVFGEDEWI